MRYKLYILGIVFILNIISCSEKCQVNDIKVSELLESVSNERSIHYCELLERAIEGDDVAIKKLSLLNFENAVGYDHGGVIVNLIIRIGEDRYLDAIKPLNDDQKKDIGWYLEVGIEYGDNSFVERKELKDVFPKIYRYLNE